jgi:Sensors of blue-light using FAD
MLVRLLYASRSQTDINTAMVEGIIKQARSKNTNAGITGLLCYCPSSHVFMQVLEGSRSAVSALYSRIAADPRHHEVILLDHEEITERRFVGWSMGEVNFKRINPSIVLKYSEQANLDPYSMSGKAAMAMLQELIDSACIVTNRSA